jgi:hypothetical protein
MLHVEVFLAVATAANFTTLLLNVQKTHLIQVKSNQVFVHGV